MWGAYNPDQTGLTKANKALPVSLAPTFTKTRAIKLQPLWHNTKKRDPKGPERNLEGRNVVALL